MPGAWTAGVRTRPKAVRVIRERERRDKWQSVSSWMRIGAPYRCHSFVCGPHIVVRPPESWERSGKRTSTSSTLSLLRPPPLPCVRACVRIRFAMDPWGCFDGRLTSDCPFSLPSCSAFHCVFFLSPSFLFFIVLTRTDPSPFHATFQVAPINEHTFFLAPDGLLGPGIWIGNDCLRRGRGMLFHAPTLEKDPEIQLFVDYRLFARITLPTPCILWCISSIPTTHSNKKRCIEEGLEAT